MIRSPNDHQTESLFRKVKKQVNQTKRKMEKIAVAPGEFGSFKNWGDDIYLEEKMFPEKFPFGVGGYLSTCMENPEADMGFANYCVSQVLSADPKFRNDSTYLFFLLLVKELVMLKRCKTTYLRQATKIPNLTKNDVLNMKHENLNRFNRSFEVFKNMRGTSMYYEDSKKNLFSLLRQNGCPTLFFTLSCAEFDWKDLLKEVIETVYKKKVTEEEINGLSPSAKNKIISENYVQSTLHFQKRIEKIFALMKYDDFFGDSGENSYHMSSYFYRIEFQARGAPHVHSLLWLKDSKEKEAPSLWSVEDIDGSDTDEEEKRKNLNERKKRIEEFADYMISTSADEIRCKIHKSESNEIFLECDACKDLKTKVSKYQTHGHTFTCMKKGKSITIKSNEGHGRNDGKIKGPELRDVPVCRFNIPKYPMDKTRLILGISKDSDKETVLRRTKDLNKIRKFLIRQTCTVESFETSDKWKKMKEMDFIQFLYEVGMFHEEKKLADYDQGDINNAKERYCEALSMDVRGTATIILKREVKDIFTNAYNKNVMILHLSNHDMQIVIDQFAAAQYVCGYLTKNEAGMSRLLKAVNDESVNLKQMEKLNKLAAVLDKHREVSVQEAVYRILGLPMTKSSVRVKYLSTIHPNFRDGLLKGKLDLLDEDENIFHTSPHQYYKNRPYASNERGVKYDEKEEEPDYWQKMSLGDFWSDYDIVYDKSAKLVTGETRVQTLLNGKGYIRKRNESAVLRYHINYENDEDMARALLILFMPFRDEMKEIHNHDVKKLLFKNQNMIKTKRKRFEKYKVMTDLISKLQKEQEKNIQLDSEEEFENEETTSEKEIQDFNNWAKTQAKNEISKLKDFINICDVIELRTKISSLNDQQRKLFDDVIERMASSDVDEPSFHLFITGNAGTGKSHLVQIVAEAVKLLKIKSGDDLQKPSILKMAPTANASFIIGGRTIDSILGFYPSASEKDSYIPPSPGILAKNKFQYEDVELIFMDEISMVGSKKLSKINFRLQDFADGENKLKFMGGKSVVASGDLWQLPPIGDRLITDNNYLDGRPDFAPSHWKENFKIYYLTLKMRSKEDSVFSSLCDRVGRARITKEDEEYLKSRIQSTDIEDDNENFKTGKISIIVTTNKKKDLINSQKLSQLLPNTKEFVCDSVDRVVNLPNNFNITEKEIKDLDKMGSLPRKLILKAGAPIVVTSNHAKGKYRDDGIMNGARGYVQAIQMSKDKREDVEAVWVVFNNENIGKLYRMEHNHMRQDFKPGHPLAMPILPERKKYTPRGGNIQYQRTNFPLSLAYAITAHKCQGETLKYVIIDFGPDIEHGINNYICSGSFYVALTRVQSAENVFLRSFDRSYILANERIEEKINAMIKFNSYEFKKIYIDQKIFVNEEDELKAGYLNINGLNDGGHAEYLNEDKNLKHLQLLIISETKLDARVTSVQLEKLLSNWQIVRREDSGDELKHMGMIFLSPKKSDLMKILKGVQYFKIFRSKEIQIQGLIIRLNKDINMTFVYCRSTPNQKEIKEMKKYCDGSQVVMGDFNLSNKKEAEEKKLDLLSGSNTYLA